MSQKRKLPSNLSDWLCTYAEPLFEDDWVAQLRTATWGSQINGISWRDVQRDEEGERAQIDIPSRCLVMDGFGNEFKKFHIRDAYVRPEYWEILDRIVTCTRGVRFAPDSDTEMGGTETGDANFQDHIPDNPFKCLHTEDWKVIVVTGSPGIGKSIFLHLLLRLRSNAALPTLFQIHSHSALLVTEHGTHKLGQATLDDDHAAEVLGELVPNMWCLVDSNRHMHSPSLFVESTGCTIVQTPSPRAPRMSWVKKMATDIEQFCMASFTPQEAIVARQFQSSMTLDERDIECWYQRFTPSFRTVRAYGSKPDLYEQVIKKQLVKIKDPAMLAALGNGVESTKLHLGGDTPHEIFIYSPPKSRQFAFTNVGIATPYLACLILDHFQAINTAKRLELYRLWRGIEPLAAATGRLLEDIVKEVVPNGGVYPLKRLRVKEKRLYVHWTVPRGSPSTPDCYLAVNGHTKHTVSIKRKDPRKKVTAVKTKPYKHLECDVHADGAFYLPASPAAPIFDLIHVQDRQAVLFQCTVSKKHDVKAVGLEQVKGLARKLGIEDVIYIGVVPEGQESTTFVMKKSVDFKFAGLYVLPFEPKCRT